MSLKKYLFESLKYALRSYPVIRPYIKEVEKLYAMSEEELQQRNEKRFLQIFRRAYDKSPFYHKLYTDAGIKKEDITCLADIKKLPVITKDMVKQHADEMLTVPKWCAMAAHTSGTTGTPLKVYQSWTSIWRFQAFTYCARKRCGYTYGQPIVSLRGHLNKTVTRLKIHASNTLYLSSYNINKNTIKDYYTWIQEHKPVAIEGYPSSLYSLALYLKEANLNLNIPIAFTSSETLSLYQRRLIENQLGTEIFDNYGMTEKTISLYETKSHKGYDELPGYSINEYLENGEIGTSLLSTDFPMIRYRSNDVIELYQGDDSKHGKVAGIVGRVDDFVVGKDGSMVSRIDFVESANHLKACQWVQREKGKLIINIVPDEGFTSVDKDFIIHETVNKVGVNNMDIETVVCTMNDLVYSKRGKFKLIVNEVK